MASHGPTSGLGLTFYIRLLTVSCDFVRVYASLYGMLYNYRTRKLPAD